MKILLALLFTAALASADPATWKPLFNGTDLTGWHTQPGGEWKVVGDTILGTSAKEEKRHGLLVTDKIYRNFLLRAKFKVTTGDSGLYFRSEETKTQVAIAGFQAEVDLSPEVGGLYETDGRAWVKRPDPALIAKLVTPGEWTSVLVTAIGDDLTVSLNGVLVTELLGDTAGRKEGRIALQLHGGVDMKVEFKDLAILELP